ncbi:hypothetical protein OK016_27545 [Vibrio chagasii]|nr:hypothetical protein [Vibrio chagasii]
MMLELVDSASNVKSMNLGPNSAGQWITLDAQAMGLAGEYQMRIKLDSGQVTDHRFISMARWNM